MIDMAYNYSQTNEQEAIEKYFTDFIGTLVDVGANNGIKYSNSRRLIELGWSGHLIEPHPLAYASLNLNTRHFPRVYTYECALGIRDSREVLKMAEDSLLSVLEESERGGFDDIPMAGEAEVDVITWETFMDRAGNPHIDFITIDAEGMDIEILTQIDLTNVQMVCIEKSQLPKDRSIWPYVNRFGLTLYHETFENLIFVQ